MFKYCAIGRARPLLVDHQDALRHIIIRHPKLTCRAVPSMGVRLKPHKGHSRHDS